MNGQSERGIPKRADMIEAVRLSMWNALDRAPDMMEVAKFRARLEEYGYVVVKTTALFDAVQTGVRWRAALRRLTWRVREAHGLLSPGMRAGTGEAKALLALGLDEAEKNALEIDPADDEDTAECSCAMTEASTRSCPVHGEDAPPL